MEANPQTTPEQAAPPQAAGPEGIPPPPPLAPRAPVAPARDERGRWLPGQSGNPGGQPAGVAKLRKHLVDTGFDERAVEELKNLCLSARSERVKFAALELVLAYVYGRPAVRVEGELEAVRHDTGVSIVVRLLERRPELAAELLELAFPGRTGAPPTRSPESLSEQ